MKLRPVAFYYKSELDSIHTRQYGLVAEEVAQIAPNLVVYDQDGQPQTVRYHFINAMLLNEVQKQRQFIERQQRENEAQQKEIDLLKAEIESRQASEQAQIMALEEEVKAMHDLFRKSDGSSLTKLAKGDH